MATFPKGFLAVLAEYPRQTFGFFDTDDNKFKTPYPRTGVVYGDKFLYLDEDYLEVRDIRTNTVLFRLDGPRFAGLHVSWASVAGNYLYLRNESDDPVIDLSTQQKVASDWKLRPTDVINEDWILTTTSETGNSSCFYDRRGSGASCESPTLMRAPNGNYAGPWN